ncbi:MAG: sulfite exporter TauE/SafE family protein [Rubrobacter sp.]|nr:sulfite exporter TauE/SafE family protein [Rubrobacter sp.]
MGRCSRPRGSPGLTVELFEFLILAVAGLFGGVFAGLFGVGGGGVFVPALVYGAGWNIKEAVAASLVIIVFSALSGAVRSYRSQAPPDIRVAALFACTVAPSTLIGVSISAVSPETLVKVVFASFLFILAFLTFRRGSKEDGGMSESMHPALALFAGVGIGTLAGLIGIGGAAMMVPLMSLGFGVPVRAAISTSLAVTVAIGVVGAGGYIFAGFDQIAGLPPIIVGSIAGAWLGVRVRDLMSDAFLQKAFAAFMVVVAVRVLLDAAGVA